MSNSVKSVLINKKFILTQLIYNNLRIFFISLIFLFQFHLILCQNNGLDTITDDCINKCHDENRTMLENRNVECGKDCYMKQCSLGCSLWEQALSTSCQTICNKTNDESNQIYCAMSCNDALSNYFKWIHNEIDKLPAPKLQPDTLSATSLTLQWNIPRKLTILCNQKPYLPKIYLIQWRYEDIIDDNWKFDQNKSINHNSTIQIDNLMPYKKYRFRVVFPLSLELNEMLVSEESDVVRTLASGGPLSKPEIVRAVPVDHTRIFVSWKSGPFINGPILSYSLELQMLSSERLSAFKEIPASENTNFYIFEKLLPSKNYSIGMAMHNSNGNGPQAKVFVETPSAPIINENEPEIRFIIGSEYSIVSQGVDFLFDPPKELYKSIDPIMGIAIHISKSLIFVSDAAGYIYKVPLEHGDKISSKRKEAILLPKSDIMFLPTVLSLDWLNDHLYILGEINQLNSEKLYQIRRCNLNGQNLIVIITGLYKKPNHLQVDPLNGYLYWSITGNSENDGLFRIDLADIKNDNKPVVQLLKAGNIGSFIIDYFKFKIQIPSQINNTINTFSLDGKFLENIRNNTQNPKFDLVKSITSLNDIFYWTNGNDLYAEDYYTEQNTYYHNQYPSGIKNTIFISISLQSIQPLPIPLNPPCNLQVLLSSRKAKIMWNKPDLLSNQGKGAWQEWYYELKIIDDSNVNNVIRDIKGTYFTVDRLKSNTNYTFSSLAYTANGHSPYSNKFHGKTLKSNHDRYIIWSSDNGLLQSDVIGENIHPLIAKNELDYYDITDLTWFEDMLFFVSNSSLKYYNRTSKILAKFNDIGSIESIDIDWIGKKIYWSTTSQFYVTRTNFNGLDKEYLPIASVVKEFKIDSLNGHIYYSTGTAIQACQLNGKNCISYINFEPYSSQILGLTLDLDNEKLYWIVRNYNGSTLYSALMVRYWHTDMTSIKIQLPNQVISKTLTLIRLTQFSDRLMWLQDDHTVIISDNMGKNFAHIQNNKLNGLKTICLIDPIHHILPTNSSTININVIPESINNDTIKISGSWRSFNISWDPVRTITYGETFYEIRIRHIDSDLLKVETTMPYFLYTNHSLSPYILLNVSIKPFTYWGSAKTSIAQLYSPVGPPSEPTKPIVFITHRNEPFRRGINISATFRWNEPKKLNGPIISYKIDCWYKDNDGRNKIIFSNFIYDNNREIILSNLLQNITYYFQSQGFSTIHEGGPKTHIIHINSSHENPIPKLLVAKYDEIIEIDMNFNKTKILVQTDRPTNHLAYIENENKLFWVNDNHELIEFTSGNSKKKIALINGHVVCLTIDWIQRIIYWVQHYHEILNNTKSVIFRLDLNRFDGRTIMNGEKILSSTEYIKDLIISPINQQLYWIQYSDRNIKYGNLIQYSINLDMELELPNNIDCLNDTFQHILLDTQSLNENRLILISNTNRIFSFGLQSYNCELLKINYDNLTQYIVKDSVYIYLLRNNTISSYNHKQILQYSINISSKVNDMLAYYHQNYPHKLCLLPRKNISNTDYIPALLRSTENSLLIQLPQIETYSNCTLKLPGIKYIIEYSEQIHENGNLSKCPDSLCKTLISYDSIEEISNLKPFLNYSLRIGITNFYAQQIGLKILYGPIVTFSTAPGPPSIPRNLTGQTISPTEIIVTWLKPEKLNSDHIWYKINWQINDPNNHIVNRDQHLIVLPDENLIENSIEKISISLKSLLPKQKYKIWIEAYSTNITFSTTSAIEIETIFPEPEDIIVIEKTANSLRLYWQKPKYIRKYILEYAIIDSDIYTIIVDSENDTRFDKDFNGNSTDKGIYLINNLQPKTIYQFSIRLFYLNRTIPYIWPSDNRFLFETLGDHPSAPGKPQIHHISGEIYKILWQPSQENGAKIEEYSLEGLQTRITNRIKRSIENNTINKEERAKLIIEPNIIDNNTRLLNQMQSIEEQEEFKENWLILYNGTENYSIKNNFDLITSMIFRVRAKNLYGWGPYSIESEPISEPYITPKRRDAFVIALIAPIIIVGICLILAGCMIFVHKNRPTKKKHFYQTYSQTRDTELMNLSCSGNFIHPSNMLYLQGPITDADIALLPQISRNQIQMSCFLGSGAFGEVYEGIVKNDSNTEIRVAIKTLRKGATEQEKVEFLQEAQLMSNFKHKHILQLIGICFDINSLFIVMELMEGGDLLTYLRQSRPHMGVPLTLTLTDLISICADVATGCRYLEEMHFVHRDLACRNCLVSSTDPEYRIVKIGDFGLARDIYKNDYYRKEGEGLLPVRWMSPESLVDGVFTSQSDIWAFGVLCWEIMTLGQQPYPARNNVEVLHYVRDGGRLGRPEDCPDGLYELMLKCWSYHPEERPTFRYCLEILHLLQENPNEEIHINDYHKKRLTIGALKLHNFDKNSHELLEPPIILTPTSSTTSTIRPKYVELLYNENSGDEEDHQCVNDVSCCGDYELPIVNIRNGKSEIECFAEESPIVNSDAIARNSVCSNYSAQLENDEQQDSKLSLSPSDSTKSCNELNLTRKNSKNINNNISNNNINNNNLGYYNCNNDVSTEIKISPKTSPLNNQDNLSSENLSTKKTDDLNNNNNNSAENNVDNNQNEH